MSVRSLATRIGITAAGGALVALATTGSATAADVEHDPYDGSDIPAVTAPVFPEAEAAPAHDDHRRLYKGRVIARPGLVLRDKPTRHSEAIGFKKYGSIVHIFCKTKGDNVDGNWRWYLLTDGTWAWGAARYIENIGPAPRWC